LPKMSELFVIAIVLAFAGLVASAALRFTGQPLQRATSRIAMVWGVVACVLAAVGVANRTPVPTRQPDDAPLQVTDSEFKSSQACRACHPDQYASWHRSYHRTMTQTASPEAVIGDFDAKSLQFGDKTFRVFERDGVYYGEMAAPDGQTGDEEGRVTVVFRQTTGSHHMQLYWYATGSNRALALFPLAYLPGEQRWIPRQSGFVEPPGREPNSHGLWNRTCLECHATNAKPRGRKGGPDTQVTELGISCESCHGPGGPHVAENASPAKRYQKHFAEKSQELDPTIVDPRKLTHERSAQVCGQCHVTKTLYDAKHLADWRENGSHYRPGDDLEVSSNIIARENMSRPALKMMVQQNPGILRSTFWSDGVIRVSGREYSALRETGCYTRGEMSCLSCHSLHKSADDTRSLDEWADDQLAPGMRTNAACTQCHPGLEEPDALTRHTRHSANSSGSQCMNCHMSYTTYGLLKASRRHRVDSPSVASELATGRPNACNQCHLDKPLGFTAEKLTEWYDIKTPELTADQREISAAVRWALEGDAGLRALTAWSLGWAPAQEASGTAWMPPYITELMNDPYDSVRIIARRTLHGLPEFSHIEYDELAGVEERTANIAAIRKQWAAAHQSSAGGKGYGESTLFDAQGNLETGTIERLLERRDLRDLRLLE
jgi:hypothetical protein